MRMFSYSKEEKKRNKALKMNLDNSESILEDADIKRSREEADKAAADSKVLLQQLGITVNLTQNAAQNEKLKLNVEDYETISDRADKLYDDIRIEDLLSASEIQHASEYYREINREFSAKTGIVNKTDMAFLAVATALQTTKSLLVPIIGKKLNFGTAFNPAARLPHNDISIKNAHRAANDYFRDKYSQRYSMDYWTEIPYKSVPYDAIKGSSELGLGLNGKNHRLKTLGHDPLLGWIFGVINILTDTVTLSDFKTYRIQRVPQFKIMPASVSFSELMSDCFDMIKNHKMNLPAAVFAQAQHLKSDVFTKQGLPVPVLGVLAPEFASDLYGEHYDFLCLARDSAFVGGSVFISRLINMLISLVHGMFYDSDNGISRELYNVRTRKILMISSSVASGSSIIAAAVTKNPYNLDIGGLLSTISRLFCDINLITCVKKEFIDNIIDRKLRKELSELDKMIESLT